MSNSVTLGTRVRIEILKAMAKCLGSNSETMYVSAFSSRPLLHVRPKETGSRQLAFTFADAITRYGKQIRQSDLGEAYRRLAILSGCNCNTILWSYMTPNLEASQWNRERLDPVCG